MAIGGVLRAAIQAGRLGAAARESRQRARAVLSLNQGGGIGATRGRFPIDELGFERMAGGSGFGATARGATVVVDPASGARRVLPQSFDDFSTGVPMPRSPIAAPYEDFRVIPRYSEMYTPEYIGGEMPMIPRAFFPTMPRSMPPMRKQPASGPSRSAFYFDDLSNPFGRNERMPQWYIDDMMQNWQ